MRCWVCNFPVVVFQRALPIQRAASRTLCALMRNCRKLDHRQDMVAKLIHGKLCTQCSNVNFISFSTTIFTIHVLNMNDKTSIFCVTCLGNKPEYCPHHAWCQLINPFFKVEIYRIRYGLIEINILILCSALIIPSFTFVIEYDYLFCSTFTRYSKRRITVKPALVTTCLQRSPIYKGHICCFPWKWFLIESCTKGTCLQRPPVYKGPFLCSPWVVAIDRFDCTYVKIHYQCKNLFISSSFLVYLTECCRSKKQPLQEVIHRHLCHRHGHVL